MAATERRGGTLEPIEAKLREIDARNASTGAWGTVTVEIVYQKGQIHRAQVDDLCRTRFDLE